MRLIWLTFTAPDVVKIVRSGDDNVTIAEREERLDDLLSDTESVRVLGTDDEWPEEMRSQDCRLIVEGADLRAAIRRSPRLRDLMEAGTDERPLGSPPDNVRVRGAANEGKTGE